MIKRTSIVLSLLVISIFVSSCALDRGAAKIYTKTINEKNVIVFAENERIYLSDGSYFVFSLANRPVIGPNVVKISIFTEDHKDASYFIKAAYAMVDMGEMGSGDVVFVKNKTGDYLLPISTTMQGEWVVEIKIEKDGKAYYEGEIKFKV